MMDKYINRHPEFEQLTDECDLLKSELATLYTEYDLIKKTIIPNIEADYLVKLGAFQYELTSIQIEIRRMKREIEIIQSAINRGKKASWSYVQVNIEAELAEWETMLKEQYDRIVLAKLMDGSHLSYEDNHEIKKTYRALAKKLHPDVNPDQSDAAKNLWLQAQDAYHEGDIVQIRAIALLAEDIPDNYDLPNSIDVLKNRRNELKDHVNDMLAKIAKLKSHPMYQLAEKLCDSEYVAKEKINIQEQIEVAKKQRLAIKTVWDEYIDGVQDE